MQKLLVLLAFACTAFALPAQTEPDEYAIFPLQAGSENTDALVFGDKINVRTAPNKDAAVVAQLNAGERVHISAIDTTTFTMNGWTANWCKIAFSQNGARKEGYAWAGLLCPQPLQSGDVSFVYNVVKSTAGGPEDPVSQNDIEIRAVRNGKIIHTIRTRLAFESGYYTSAVLYNNLGLPGYSNVLKITFMYPACGYTSYDVWCLWNGSTLQMLPELSNFADAGVVYYSESYIFPDGENGIPDKILFRVEQSNADLETGELDEEVHVRPMIQNGKNYVKPKMPKE